MNLHEYQGKQLFKEYGLPVSDGIAASTPEEAVAAADKIGGSEWVVKCQVHAGGRGKAGGVKLVKTKEEIKAFAEKWLGKNLVTFQTDEHGQPVTKILVETCTVRIFLSSTFRDFGEERDLLVRRLFPTLRARLQSRFVDLIDVDLRWGITAEEAERGDVLPICLSEIAIMWLKIAGCLFF